MKILVLGAGHMGLGAVCDLSRNSEVRAVTVDFDLARANAIADLVQRQRIGVAAIDLSNYQRAAIKAKVRGIVISETTSNLSVPRAVATV